MPRLTRPVEPSSFAGRLFVLKPASARYACADNPAGAPRATAVAAHARNPTAPRLILPLRLTSINAPPRNKVNCIASKLRFALNPHQAQAVPHHGRMTHYFGNRFEPFSRDGAAERLKAVPEVVCHSAVV